MSVAPGLKIMIGAGQKQFNGLCLGVGVGMVVESQKYWHLPLALLLPGAYVGYQLFYRREDVLNVLAHRTNDPLPH
jgi:hypothetical protein